MEFKHPKTPEWFDNKNYDGAEKLKAQDWFYLFSERWMIYDSFKNEIPETDFESDDERDQFWTFVMLNNFLKEPLKKSISTDNRSRVDINQIVTSPTLSFIDSHVFFAKASKLDMDQSANLYKQDYGEPLSFALVDLSAPKDLIVDSFKSWLNDELKKVKACGKDQFEKEKYALISHRVLQYIDLMLYGMSIKKHYTNEEVAGIIFGFEAGADKIRQTTKPKAIQCLSEVYCNWLRYFFD
ncbi:MAG: DUF6387 family protein [Thiomicrorhabdus chilensis]|uniref:DUF6387 family protein n=1 Tax=Thiomicrorhabdus chilensis TaxID=63656 RepID=UPI00299E8C18|nr:DUF6387 family protein [Thiomicrorhabdus chilensis]MDX1346966.1 DUF6387 family protein [Thiomicrorhabdus chilensis]